MTTAPSRTYPSLLALAGLTLLLLVAGGGSGEGVAGASTSANAKATHEALIAGGKRVKTGKTRYGRILQDSRGRTLYLFTKDRRRKRSRCYGACARAWPPLITRGKPVAIKGARRSKLGTTRRRSGKRQVTYNGHPLYYYVDEDEPNEVLCQAVREFGGLWYVVNRHGKAIRKR